MSEESTDAMNSTDCYPIDAWACVLDWVTDVRDASHARLACRLFRDLLRRRKRFARKREFRTAMIEGCGAGQLERVVFLHETHPGWTCGKSCVLHGTLPESLRKQFSDLETTILCHKPESLCLAAAMDNAAQRGHLEVVRWLHEHRVEGCTLRAMDSAIVEGHLHVARWLRQNLSVGYTSYCPLEVARKGRLEALQWMNLPRQTLKKCIEFACEGGHLQTAQWLQETTRCEKINVDAINKAAENGHDEVVHWLRKQCSMEITPKGLRWAATNGQKNVLVSWLATKPIVLPGTTDEMLENSVANGHLDLVRWLVDNFPEAKCSDRAAYRASFEGHSETIRWLASRTELHSGVFLTERVMDAAAFGGNMDLLLWCHGLGVGCTTDAMDWAAHYGELDVIRWLHENRTEGCTTKAMNGAAQEGHLDVVRWLHEHRTEGCTTKAMNRAAGYGHLDVVRWLHENRNEGCTTKAMDKAAARGHLHVLRWLHENRTEGCTSDAFECATRNGHLRVLKFLWDARREQFDVHDLANALISSALLFNKGHVFLWLSNNISKTTRPNINL